jgi:site-specific DNA-cytosine methylase
VPQRRRRIFFVGRLGAPGRPEVLFESEGGGGDPAAGGEEGKIAAGELARSLGAVGGGNDYGANKGTLVRPKRVASAVTASAGHHGHSSPRGDGTDNIVADKAATIGTNHRPDRGQRGENIVAGTLQSCSDKQGRKTPEVDQLVAPLVEAATKKAHAVSKGTGGGLGGRDGQDDYVLLRVDQTNSHPVIKKDKVTDSIATGTGHGGYANQAIARVEVFEPRFARNGRGAPDVVAPPLKAENGRTGKGDGAPCVVGPSVAAPLTAGSHPNSHMAGRRREDDQNIVATGDATAFQARYYTRGGKAGGRPSKTVDITNTKKAGDSAPLVAASMSPCLDSTFSRTGRGRTEAQRLVQQPLFIHTADAGANQNQVKRDGKADCLSEAQPGAVAFDPTGSTVDHGPSAPTLKAGSGGASGHHAAVAQPIRDPIGFHSTGGGAGISDKKLCPPITVGSGKDIPSPPAVAYDVRGMAQGGRSHAVETGTTGTVDTDGRNPSGNEAGTLVGPTPMSVRRLTPTECERLQGFPDGWTCLCNVRPDCPDRRIPPWLDPSTFKLGGCGHSACGCTCADSPRYKSLGNAVATCAVNWIGKRQILTVGKSELKEVALG